MPKTSANKPLTKTADYPKRTCYIRATMHLPDDIDVLNLDWEPAKREKRQHYPLRIVLHRLGQQIAADEVVYLRQRLNELGEQIEQEQKLAQFQQEFQTLEAKVLKEMGL